MHPNYGLCRSETIQVVLDCTQGSGICLGPQTPCGRGYIIAQVLTDSVSERSGCIQKGDRILSVNKLYNLDISSMRQILGDIQLTNKIMGHQGTHWVEIEIEFDMADSVIPSSGVFNVKLVKQNKSGLGITVNGSSHGAFVIAEVKPGSPAHRTGSLRAGDILLAVDSHPIQHFNVDMLLKENKNEYITLTVKRNSLPDFLFDAQQRSNAIYGSSEDNAFGYGSRYADPATLKPQSSQANYFQIDDSRSPNATLSQIRKPNWNSQHYDVPRPINTQSMTTEITEDPYGEAMPYNIDYPQRLAILNLQDHSMYTQHSNNNTPDSNDDCSPLVFNVRLESNGGPLGITLAGSEDLQKPIVISGLIEGIKIHLQMKHYQNIYFFFFVG
jgi:glutamate receptor-interacting protein